MADDLDRLADHLDASYQERIDAVIALLREINQFPANYRAVVMKAREALELYEELVTDVGERENLEQP